jgi:hypothetical protein
VITNFSHNNTDDNMIKLSSNKIIDWM